MNTPLRILDTGMNSARWNIAMTAALSELHLTGAVADTLRLHSYERSVLLGRHQLLDDAIDRGLCVRRGIEIARRITGGGSVYMSPCVLAWDLVVARTAAPSLEDASATVCGAIAAALAELGFAARFRPPGDVLIGEKKVSGSAGWHDGGTMIHQGTVLIDADLEEMAQALKLPWDANTPLPVTTLANCAAHVPSIQAVSDAMSRAIAQAFDRTPVSDQLSAQGIDLTRRLLTEEIGTEEFVEGETEARLQPASLPA